ncbi:MAG: carbonic anhydrase family protein [Zoogloea sp.]|nr:carbonic anhydrase family protein [Zoogloea sp.]
MRMRTLAALLALAGALPALAADWHTIAADKQRKIEVDRNSILPSDNGTKIAWGRIVLSDAAAGEAGYATVKALNRYDCAKRSFTTVKRVFLDGDAIMVKEELVRNEKAVSVAAGSLDERLWNEVCRPPSAKDLAKVAEEAGRAASATRSHVRTADYRTLDEGKSGTRGVSDAKEPVDAPPARKSPAVERPAAHGDKPQDRSERADTAADKPARPNFIEKPARPPHMELDPQAEPETRSSRPSYIAPPRRVVRRKPAPPPVVDQVGHAASFPVVHRDIHWSYDGENGPVNWGVLKPEWKLCGEGERQSPIDIHDGVKVDLEPIHFDYKPSYFRIVDNGHTIQAGFGQGNTLNVMGRTYDLVQIHFHRPSEERVNGRGFDMVAHLVHKDLDGRLAVVAVLLERGQPNPLVQTLWNNLPLERDADYSPQVAIELEQILPADRSYYTYMGSLTTPPCSEGVLWMVMKQPVQVSAEQIAIFSRLYPMNARPVQSAKGRLIKESR